MEYSLTIFSNPRCNIRTTVLILVLMEYSLTVLGDGNDPADSVLILILMEYSLTSNHCC